MTAPTIAQLAGILNIGAGVLLMVALLFFFSGFSVWITHLGLPYREEGIIQMERGVTILFVLVCILAVVRFFHFHTQAVLQILAIAVALLIGWLIIVAIQQGGKDEEKR